MGGSPCWEYNEIRISTYFLAQWEIVRPASRYVLGRTEILRQCYAATRLATIGVLQRLALGTARDGSLGWLLIIRRHGSSPQRCSLEHSQGRARTARACPRCGLQEPRTIGQKSNQVARSLSVVTGSLGSAMQQLETNRSEPRKVRKKVAFERRRVTVTRDRDTKTTATARGSRRTCRQRHVSPRADLLVRLT